MLLIKGDDKKRKSIIIVKCAACGENVMSRKDQVRKYCSKVCAYKGRSNKIEVDCGYCGRKTEKRRSQRSKSGLFFCCRQHKDWGQRVENGLVEIQPSHYGDGKSSYRERALRAYGAKCNGCGYCEVETMLDVHHVNENRNDGSLENLMVLCVFCHALVTRSLVEILPDRKIVRKI